MTTVTLIKRDLYPNQNLYVFNGMHVRGHIAAIKHVRSILSCGLKVAKDAMDYVRSGALNVEYPLEDLVADHTMKNNEEDRSRAKVTHDAQIAYAVEQAVDYEREQHAIAREKRRVLREEAAKKAAAANPPMIIDTTFRWGTLVVNCEYEVKNVAALASMRQIKALMKGIYASLDE